MSDLLELRDLEVEFDLPEGVIRAVNGVSFNVRAGSVVALVGESGSGKSVVSQAIMGILPDTARISGRQILLADPAADGPTVDIAAVNPRSRDAPLLRALVKRAIDDDEQRLDEEVGVERDKDVVRMMMEDEAPMINLYSSISYGARHNWYKGVGPASRGAFNAFNGRTWIDTNLRGS